MIYLLNTPVLTAYGNYRFSGPLTEEQAANRVRDGFISAIGHESAATFLSALLKTEIPKQRIAVEMQPGDMALVLRLRSRLPEGKLLTAKQMSQVDYELGWIERLQ